MTSDAALKIAAVWRAVNLVANAVGQVPLQLLQRDGSGGKVKLPGDLYNLMRYGVLDLSALDLRQTLTAHAMLKGNGYAYIVQDADGRPLDLWILPPDDTLAVRETDKETGRSQVYYLTKIGGKDYILPSHKILHIKGLGGDGLSGYSVVTYFASDGLLTTAMRDYSKAFFQNGAWGGVVIEFPGTLTDDQFEQFKAKWNSAHAGPEKAFSPVLLEFGMKVGTCPTVTARDAQLLEARAFQLRDIANWFGVPPHKLGDNSRTAYNSIEAENSAFLSEGLDIWLVRWENECRAKMLTEEDKRNDSKVFEFQRAALLRTALTERGNYYSQAVNRWMTLNEIRAAENLPAVANGNELKGADDATKTV